MFDKDGGGTISAEEIKAIFCTKDQKIDDLVWDKIIQEVDDDGSGEIDFEEFSIMMKKLMEDDDDDEPLETLKVHAQLTSGADLFKEE